MPSYPPAPAIDESRLDGCGDEGVSRSFWGPLLVSVLVLWWFYGFETRYGSNRGQSALGWLWSAWNGETDYEHGPLFLLIIGGVVVHRFKRLKAAAGHGSAWGLLLVLVGALLYAVAYRTLQPRVAIGALPFLLWGAAWYCWGWRLARMLLFPLFFFLLAIPLPSFQQATNQLQLLATSMAHHGAALCGVETLVQGNQIVSAHGGWEPLEIATSGSGIRSLMALLMISGVWAFLADLALWKRVLLFLSAFPLAILGNSLRVISIFVIAQYGDEKWARHTWYDWSGLLLFYPFCLLLMVVIHGLLAGGPPWRKANPQQRPRLPDARADDVRALSSPCPRLMPWNAWCLPLLLGGALGAVYFLPGAGEVAASAMKIEMPGSLGGWSFQTLLASKEELGMLGTDTEFAKAICLRPRPGEVGPDGRRVPNRVDLAVVLSGHDLNNSIHRPERCMPIQGHAITDAGNVMLRLPNGRAFAAKRLHSVQTIQLVGKPGETLSFPCVTYYFFVGYDRICDDYLERALLDMKDRLVRGMDQRWAYVSASMWYGKLPWIDKDVAEAEADATLRKFVSDLAEKQLDWDQIQR